MNNHSRLHMYLKVLRYSLTVLDATGKTILATGLARDEGVRAHFEVLLWLTLGQEPDLRKLLQLLHLQATGRELPADKSVEEGRQMNTLALRGRRCLLILDDVWVAAHEAALNCVDAGAGSRTLATTRIKGLVPGAGQVELDLPSRAEAVALLLASAGLPDLSPGEAPAEAAEVVELCGRLPLAVDIAGRLLGDLGLRGGDWAGVPRMLQLEMRRAADDGEESSLEYRVIDASLSSLSRRQQRSATTLLGAFALVAEDVAIPPAALALVLSAAAPPDDPALGSALGARKVLQLLINRSLVLGTWERPSLHDIVREYAIALHSPDELRRLQRRVLAAFARARPAKSGPDNELSVGGRVAFLRGWPRGGNFERRTADQQACADYATSQMQHHVRGALQWTGDGLADPVLPPEVAELLTHYGGHVFGGGCGLAWDGIRTALGLNGLLTIRDQAERAENWWLAIQANGLAIMHTFTTKGDRAFNGADFFEKWWLYEEKLEVDDSSCTLSQAERDHSAIGTRASAIKMSTYVFGFLDEATWDRNWASLCHLFEHTETGRLQRARQKPALELIRELGPLFKRGELEAADTIVLRHWQEDVAKVAAERTDTAESAQSHAWASGLLDLWDKPACSSGRALDEISGSVSCLIRLHDWDWSVFGDDFELILQSYEAANWELPRDLAMCAWGLSAESPFLAALHGNLGVANRCYDLVVEHFHAAAAALAAAEHSMTATFAMPRVILHNAWPLYLLGRRADVLAMYAAAGLSWATAGSWVDAFARFEGEVQQRGAAARLSSETFSAEVMTWQLKLLYALCSTWRECPVQAVVDALPSPEQLDGFIHDVGTTTATLPHRQRFDNLLLLAAEVCSRKLDRPADGLLYLARALRGDPADPTTDMRPTTAAHGLALRGELLLALGRIPEAAQALEQAADGARRHGLRLYEALALSCLQRVDGRAEAAPRLATGRARMVGPAEAVARLLGEAVDLS
jgi:tetratricopeptide (TPR) repeat protein